MKIAWKSHITELGGVSMRMFNSLKERDRIHDWMKSLKEGDEVTNVIKFGFQDTQNNPPIKILKVKKVTPTGRVRLEDGTLWKKVGTPVSPKVLGQLWPVTEKHREFLNKLTT